jgi:tetratricopeptide (TPR) repeat protein
LKPLNPCMIKKAEGDFPLKTILLLLFLLWGEVPSIGAPLANQDKRGLRSYTIDGVLRLKDEEIDIGTAALILSQEWGAQRTTHVYRAKIDRFAEDILKILNEKHIGVDSRAIPVINEYLFGEQQFASVDNADNPEDLFLHSVLDKKRGYCLSLSVLYLSVCERLGLPVYGVVVPGHFFIRYDDGKRRYNIETTSQGGIAADDYYIKTFKPPLRDTALYMKNLTPRQTLGCFFNNLGNSYMEVGDIDKAFEVLQKAVQINPLLSEANMNLGNIYLQKQMPLQAIRQYENALAILGNDAKIMNNLGSAYMQLKEYAKAESWYRKAIGADPEYSDVRRNLAQALQMQGKLQAALSMLRAAVVLNPQDAETVVMLGLVCRELKEYPDAETYLLKGLALSPNHVQARLAIGYLYLEQQRYEPAVDAFQAAIAYNAVLPQAYLGLGEAYHQLERTDDEIWAYEQAIAQDSSMTAAYHNLGNAHFKQDNIAGAVDIYRKGLAVEPANAGLRYNLATALARMESHEQAVVEFLEVIRLEPDNAKAYNGAAISYYLLKNYELSKAYAKKAKDMGFDVQPALLELK